MYLKIPNILVVSIMLLFFVTVIFWDGEFQVWKHIVVAVVMLCVGAALFYFDLIGGGDAKLATAAVLWVGFDSLGSYFFIFGIAGLLVSLLFLSLRPGLEYFGLRAIIALKGEKYVPKSLISGAHIPFAVPIAIASVWLSFQMPFFR
jgi:prepilin peptidase CpaA